MATSRESISPVRIIMTRPLDGTSKHRTNGGGCLMLSKCDEKTEVYSRVCGFFRPVQQWNKGKKEEFRDRREYVVATASK